MKRGEKRGRIKIYKREYSILKKINFEREIENVCKDIEFP